MKETELLMGMFVNAVLLYSDLSDNPIFAEFLERAKKNILEDVAYCDTPFPAIVKGLMAANRPGRNPVFQVIFAFHDSAIPILDFEGIRGTLMERHNKTAKTDMNIICIPRMEQHVTMGTAAPPDEDLTVIWEYNSEIFERQTIERMVSHAHNGQIISYSALNLRADQLARRLRRAYRGKSGAPLAPGAHVGLCVERGIDMVVGMLAILKAGGGYVPVSPEYPEKRLRFMLDDADIKAVLSQTTVKDRVPWLWEGDWAVVSIDVHEAARGNEPREIPSTVGKSSDPAYVIYTSGSTGIPKGVAVSHRAVHNIATSAPALHYSERDVISQMANHAFDAATFEIWGSLISGAKIVIIDSDAVLNPDRLLKIMEENHVTVSFFTTALFNLLAESKVEVLIRLRSIHFGGEMANPHCVRKVLSCKGDETTLFHVYGPTECTTYSTVCELTDKYAASDMIPIGRPLPNYTAYVLDEKLRLVPVGVPGELHIGGDSVAMEYIHRPELTEHRFIPNLFATEEDRKNDMNLRLYRTGDLVRWLPDGTLHILGRTDFQVKIRGFRIEPEEVERVLLKHPGVRQCIVIPWEGNLVAYWVPSDPSDAVGQSDLRSFLATQLPEYMVPSGFIETGSFELNRNAKIDRSKLPPPSLGLLTREKGEYVAPARGEPSRSSSATGPSAPTATFLPSGHPSESCCAMPQRGCP